MKYLIILFISVLFLTSCKSDPPYTHLLTSHISESVSHQPWDKLLKNHVEEDGWVDYRAFLTDSNVLNSYLDTLSQNPPAQNWTRNEKLAYWINLYNAFTVKIIIDNYPLTSITDIKQFHIPLVNTVWHDRIIHINNTDISLNYVEHEILRKKFDEPRIHFAINCASISCPKLRNEAYSPENIDYLLDKQAYDFFNDPSKNSFAPGEAEISKIFQWFRKDFIREMTLIAYLNKYSPVKLNEDADISYKKYDWKLNEQH